MTEAVKAEAVAIRLEILQEIFRHSRDLEVQTTLRVEAGRPDLYGLIIGRGRGDDSNKLYWEDPQFASRPEAIARIRTILEAALDTAQLSPNFSGGLNQKTVDRIAVLLTARPVVYTYHPSFWEDLEEAS